MKDKVQKKKIKKGLQQTQMGELLPYDRFLRFGPENLTEAELLAIILRTGTADSPALELAEQVLALARYPRMGLLGLYDVSLEELMKIRGIGKVKAVKLKSLTELSGRLAAAKALPALDAGNPATIAEYFREKVRHRKTECVYIACLDAKCHLIAERKISEGSVNAALVSPREVFLAAMEEKAVHIVMIHNHPSGDPTPSQADVEITAAVLQSGSLLGISLLDHIIIGDSRYFSFLNAGYLRQAKE